MEFYCVRSPSRPQCQSTFSAGSYFDTTTTSERSSPDCPSGISQIIYSTAQPLADDGFDYSVNTTKTNFYLTPQSDKAPIAEYTSSTSLQDRVRSRRVSGAISNASTSSASGKDKESATTMHLRRRAQNRASQRAFRERKEKHVKGLEHQLETLHEKHQDLLIAYNRQAAEVSRLNSKISKLSSELDALRSSYNGLHAQSSENFDKFDAFPSQPSHDMLYNGAGVHFDNNAVNLNAVQFALHSFEDSL